LIAAEYALPIVVDRYIELYRSMLSRGKSGL
jgi:hypothetical protein